MRKRTKYCSHPAKYVFAKDHVVDGWCKYCRMKAFGGHSNDHIKREYEMDNKITGPNPFSMENN